ncbi:ADP-ribosylation factor-like protein 13A [Melozone crissalis]|uniref:ADP-ribosylation factor-like protein 13A n=1 Tax=Melozone crissalis TaxID=40204 RepID=UPI0023DB3996|nr:ADP-ribosylation factor-like protein 13A [Melozone crissalis]
MFHLFSHCWSWLQAVQEPVRKVTLLVMGLDNAGKTSVIADIERALPGEALPGAQPGQSRLRLDRFEVTLRDLPGAPRSRSAWRSHYSEAHGLLFVLDSADLARMEEARKVLSRVLSHPDVSGKPLLLLANKQDAPAAMLPCELIERLCLERLVNEHRSPCRIRSPRRSPLSVARRSRVSPSGARPHPLRSPRRERPLPGEDARENGEPRAVRPGCRLLPLEESAKGARRRKRKVKVKKKGLGQAGPAEEPEAPGAGAAGGLLLPNRVGQEEASAIGTGTPHPARGTKKKKKKKIKNKIKSREPSLEQQREEVSSTFDLYRRAMLALKMRQEQRKQPSAIAP